MKLVTICVYNKCTDEMKARFLDSPPTPTKAIEDNPFTSETCTDADIYRERNIFITEQYFF